MTARVSATRELALRESDGVPVVLLWHPREDAVTASVKDARADHPFELECGRALEAATTLRPRLGEKGAFDGNDAGSRI